LNNLINAIDNFFYNLISASRVVMMKVYKIDSDNGGYSLFNAAISLIVMLLIIFFKAILRANWVITAVFSLIPIVYMFTFTNRNNLTRADAALEIFKNSSKLNRIVWCGIITLFAFVLPLTVITLLILAKCDVI
jgi:hypothetical protein